MKKYLNRKWLFMLMLYALSLIARTYIFWGLASFIASIFAKLNLAMSKKSQLNYPSELAEQWKKFMPIDQKLGDFKVGDSDDTTAKVEIHICCPLRNSGNVKACHALMNYDRTLLASVGGQLIVLKSQATPGTEFCTLAIRKKGVDTSDLKAAYQKL